MKKLIIFVLVCSLLMCSTFVVSADEFQVVIDTEVPVFSNLVDNTSYTGTSKAIRVADLSNIEYIVLRKGSSSSIPSLGEQNFPGYTQVAKSSAPIECINYTQIYTVKETGSYMVYAIDEYDHDIAVRFRFTYDDGNGSSGGSSGGGGGGGGGTITVKQPYINDDPDNKGGEIVAGDKVILDSDSASVTIYYTTDGSKPTTKSTKYKSGQKITLNEGDVLKAIAVKRGTSSEVSEWTVVAKEESPTTEPDPSKPSGGTSGGSTSIVKDILEAENHIVYLNGYQDGSFRPDNNMTRAEVATMFARLMKEKMDMGATYESSFADVTPDAWYYSYIGYIEKFGVINGYEDGNFRPDNTITRAEFVTMASRFAKIEGEYEINFADVTDEHWAYNYIAFASGNSWVGGYKDNTFRPDNTITRAEVVTIVNNMLVREADKEYADENKAALVAFIDVDESHWAYYDIVEATNEHDYTLEETKEIWKR